MQTTQPEPLSPASPALEAKPSHRSTAIRLDYGLAVGIVGVVLLTWEVVVRLREIPVYFLPAPTRILSTLLANPALYLQATGITLAEAAGGLLLGGLAGAGVALLLGLWPRMERGVMALAILIKSTPLVAIAPLLTIWLGFGMLPKIIITALMTFFPVLVNMLAGLNAADPARIATLRSWHASQIEILRYVRLPEALPYLFAALKVSGPLALIGAVVAEWTGASGGLGRLMWLAYSNLNLPYLFAAVFLLSAMGVGVYTLVNWAERKIIFWES
jgi:NitT/TauT family transport system permease protein